MNGILILCHMMVMLFMHLLPRKYALCYRQKYLLLLFFFYRSNTSILAQKKKNQKKKASRQRALERRHSEGSESEKHDEDFDDKVNTKLKIYSLCATLLKYN